jgi:hypothetical protein
MYLANQPLRMVWLTRKRTGAKMPRLFSLVVVAALAVCLPGGAGGQQKAQPDNADLNTETSKSPNATKFQPLPPTRSKEERIVVPDLENKTENLLPDPTRRLLRTQRGGGGGCPPDDKTCPKLNSGTERAQ